MHRVPSSIIASTIVAVVFLAVQWTETQAEAQTSPQSSETETLQAVTLVFGYYDEEPSPWDGSVSISAGAITKIRPHHFRQEDKISNKDNSWQVSTKPWPNRLFSAHLHPREFPRPILNAVRPIGITIEYRGPETAVMQIKLKEPRKLPGVTFGVSDEQAESFGMKAQADQFQLRLHDLPESGWLQLLNGRILAFRVPPVEQITKSEYEDDYPSVHVDQTGNMWVAWIGYRDKEDEVLVRRRHEGAWSEPMTVSDSPGDHFSTDMAMDATGRLWVVWSQREDSDWHLMARAYDGTKWGPIEQLTHGAGNNIFHRITSDSEGTLHVVWQGSRGGRFDILSKSLKGNRWTDEIALSDPDRPQRANDWMPAVAADRSGTVWVAWDSYASGNYNIMLRPVKKGKPGELIHVTNSPRFHAHANLAVDDQDRLWVAYDEAAENWGKDFGLLFEGGTCLYAGRRLRFAILDNGKWLEPRDDLNKRIMPEDQGFAATGQLCADGQGRMWVVFRPRTENETHMTWFGQGNKWELLASYYSGERWSDPVKLPESLSYNEGPFDTAADPDGRIWLAWMTDRRFWQFSALPRHNDILAASLIAHSQAPMSLGPRSTEPPGKGPADRDEQANLARIRDYSIRSGTKTYKIYRGDLHRHTDLSGDGAGDGSVWDFYRYMLDAANMDFGAITDHRGHPTYDLEYPWWRIEKSADMFHIPDFYVSLFGYERSAPPPQGHRNLFFDHRGVPVLSFQDQEAFFAPDSGDRWEHPEARRDGKISSGAFLYPYLIEHGGIAIPHHTASTNMGTDWRDNDPRLEPVVEIFQGSRISYEHTKAPLNPFGKRSDYQFQEVQGFMPWGTVWRAWSKGFKLGVIASSDHISTHCSYACVFSDDYSRRGLIEAMRKRHTYGATDNIIMDVRLQDGDDEYLMGDELTTSRIPQLSVKLIGTGAIQKVDVFRRTRLIHSRPGQGPDIEFTLREESLDAGKHYYYVRMEQVDGNVAWASPIWVEYRP